MAWDSTTIKQITNSRYEIEEASEFLEPVDKVPLIDDEDDYQVSIEI